MKSELFIRYREEMGLTQRQLVEPLGRSRAMVINYENHEESHPIPLVTALALEHLVQLHRMKLFRDDVRRFKGDPQGRGYTADSTIDLLTYFIGDG